MTDEIVKVNPIVVDEIEFYVSSDGKYTGMSITGLARMSGVKRQTLSKLLASVNEGSNLELLEPLKNKVFHTQLEADNSAKIVDSEACAAVIEYYAFDSKVSNPTAIYSYRKFAKWGIDKWIKSITGYADKSEELALLDSIKEILKEVKELKQTTIKYENIRGKTTVVFPNLDTMLEEMSLEENLLPDNNSYELTATEWLATKGITLDKSKRHKFACMLADTYRSTTGREPKKTVRTTKDGKKNNGVLVYLPREFPILQLCLNKLFVA